MNIAKYELVGSKQVPGRETKCQMASGNAGMGLESRKYHQTGSWIGFGPRLCMPFINFVINENDFIK